MPGSSRTARRALSCGAVDRRPAARSLGRRPGPVDAMAFSHLLAPLRIGPVRLRNRIVSSSHQTTLVHEHLPTDELVAYQAARAAGETGLIIMEAVAVAPSGLLTAHTLGGYLDPIVDGYRRVAAAVQEHGLRPF